MKHPDIEIINSERVKIVVCSLNVDKADKYDTEKEVPWYYNRFSSYLNLVRVIAWMRRFLKNTKKLKPERCYTNLTVEEAELMLLRCIQLEVFFALIMF